MQQDSTKITQSSPGGSFAKQDFYFFFYCVNDIHQDQDIRQIEVENKSV